MKKNNTHLPSIMSESRDSNETNNQQIPNNRSLISIINTRLQQEIDDLIDTSVSLSCDNTKSIDSKINNIIKFLEYYKVHTLYKCIEFIKEGWTLIYEIRSELTDSEVYLSLFYKPLIYLLVKENDKQDIKLKPGYSLSLNPFFLYY